MVRDPRHRPGRWQGHPSTPFFRSIERHPLQHIPPLAQVFESMKLRTFLSMVASAFRFCWCRPKKATRRTMGDEYKKYFVRQLMKQRDHLP